MDLPMSCRAAIEARAAEMDMQKLKNAVSVMTAKYKEESGHGKRLVTEELAVMAYAAVRMPATFGAVSTALAWTLETLAERDTQSIGTVLDLGAGTGAGAFAVGELLPSLSCITCVERETAMRRMGETLLKDSGLTGKTEWITGDAAETADALIRSGRKFDLVMASYMTNEMAPAARRELYRKMCTLSLGLVLLIEPGTPVGFSILRDAKTILLGEGMTICAPCPAGCGNCPMDDDDWCHFTCRVQRGKLHKFLKGGDVPYEDEKFSYLAAARGETIPAPARILRHPITEPGKIGLTLCTGSGKTAETVYRRDKARFTRARKADCGDQFE
ncbi:MAG: small ribosomal subunit Rsm22 family protein [Clostridia bacterium]|nr:small ribosomal subunit Rsm22 family protein [Clostridia bacterium]